MKVAGIIAEYNPFHNGHKYHIQETRRQTGADYIIVIMSGDFVQRGEPALTNKYLRTEMALHCGADLVLELPVQYSTASAEHFAMGAVSIFHALNCVDFLSFGAETESLDAFQNILNVLSSEPASYRIQLSSYLKNGLSYPAARMKALSDCLKEDVSFLTKPNNILVLEYLKALRRLSSEIRPILISRIGAGYHSTDTSHLYSSASGIRKVIHDFSDSYTDFLPENELRHTMPDYCASLLLQNFGKRCPIFPGDFSSQLQYCLLSASSPEEISAYSDIDPFLANRIFRLRYNFRDYDSFCELLKSKNQTLLHIKRALIHILLKINSSQSVTTGPAACRILGMNRAAAPLLHSIKQYSRIPVISKNASAPMVINNFYQNTDLIEAALNQWNQDLFSSNLYEAVSCSKYQQSFRHENTRPVIII